MFASSPKAISPYGSHLPSLVSKCNWLTTSELTGNSSSRTEGPKYKPCCLPGHHWETTLKHSILLLILLWQSIHVGHAHGEKQPHLPLLRMFK